MRFAIRKDALDWFKDIQPSFQYEFDSYHLCLMVGLAANKRISSEKGAYKELIDNFPEDFRAKSRLTIALLIINEIKRRGLHYDDKKEMTDLINRFIEPDNSSKLSSEGILSLNEYSSGGFELLTETFASRPSEPEIFFGKYDKFLQKTLVENGKENFF